MQMDKKSKKFLKALARKLTEDDRPIKSKTLKKKFSKAVTGLPERTLQKVLLDNFTDCLEFLKIRIKKLQDKSEVVLSIKKNDTKDEVQEEEDEEETVDNKYNITNKEHEFPYNFYLTDRSNVLTNPDSKDNTVENNFFLLKIQQEDNQNAVIKLVKEFQRITQEKSIMTALDRLLVLSSGIKDIKLVKKLLSVYLRKMQPLTEKYLEEENTNKISIVYENLHKLLYVSHMRYHSIKSAVKEEKPYYKDLVASLLSVYLDLSVFLFRNEEVKIKLSRLLYGFISFMTTDFPDQRYDVLLQLTQTQDDQVPLIFPLIQYCVETTPDNTDSQSYIKYILSVALINSLSQQVQLTFQHGIKKARTIVPPPGTERWLAEHIPELTDVDEEVDNLSTYLLDNMTDSLQSKLIDSLCDDEGIRDEDEEEEEEDNASVQKLNKDDILVFNPDLSDTSFFGSPDSAQISSEDDNMGDIFMVDRKGKNDKKKNQNVKTVEEDISDDKDEVDFGNVMSLNGTDFVSPTKFANTRKPTMQSPAINSSPRRIAIVSPNRQLKQVTLSEEDDKAVSSDDLRKKKKHITASPDKSTCVQSPKKTLATNDALVISPKLRSTAKYISTSPSNSNVISPSNLLDELSPKSKSPTKSQKLKSPDHSGIKSPIISDIKSPSQSEVKSLTQANLRPVQLNSPVQLEVGLPGIKSPKMKLLNQPEIMSPKMKSPSHPEIKSPKLKSPSQHEIRSPKMKSPSQPEIRSPKMKSPSQPEIRSPSQNEIKSPVREMQSGVMSTTKESGLSPRLKSPKTMSPTKLTSPLRQVTQQTPTISKYKVIDLSSESSVEASKSPSLRKVSRTRKPSWKAEDYIKSPSSVESLSTADDQEGDVQLISSTKTRKMESSIKEYTIISDSESTDMEPTLRSSRKRISEIPDLAVHLNKSRKTSSSESDTHLKTKRRSRTSESSSENIQFTSLVSPRPVKNSRKGSNDALNTLSNKASSSNEKNEELSGKQMLGILEVVKEDEEMITGHKTTGPKLRSPIGLRKRSTSESHISEIRTPSKRSSMKSVSDNETSTRSKTPRSIETRMRTRRTSTGSMSDDETKKLTLERETTQHISSHQSGKIARETHMEKIEESDLEPTSEKSSPEKQKSLTPRGDGTTSRLSLKKKSPNRRYSLRTR
ncbi:muscle M-line assembly protein unc-89 [Patella vulgata]|uniref:muscle M-line assembly protein unc-89 n=1 Tax=Patella vulgata TaxID=6465 RepID=UPI002180646B|nr:muscle M-line assembly protein unc-89 [Patella vulgata]